MKMATEQESNMIESPVYLIRFVSTIHAQLLLVALIKPVSVSVPVVCPQKVFLISIKRSKLGISEILRDKYV